MSPAKFSKPLMLVAGLGVACVAMLSRADDKAQYVPISRATLAPTVKPTATAKSASRRKEPTILELIKRHRKWKRVNAAPQITYVRGCVAPIFAPVSPHGLSSINVYVNSKGRKAMLTRDRPHFPVGSIIVKEKFSDLKLTKLELMTVMIKRAKGFNEKNGDWEYATVNHDSSRVEAVAGVEDCRSCHASAREQDYVFRSYVPGVSVPKIEEVGPQHGDVNTILP